ncbi:MAG: sensor domain-containing diguanylate cyclase [Acetobacteraceae bacterium]|nr:sensor domain-containing diguanylate cyclase [Acetobacteraceae bacterium]
MRTADEPPASSDHLRQALIESRQRWRDFGAMAADFAFEVDGEGRLSFLAPDHVLGWPAEQLLGRRAADLFYPDRTGWPDPFLAVPAMKQQRAWVRDAEGREVCLALSSTPVRDAAGEAVGARCVAADITAQEERELAAAAALRRAAVLNHIFDQMRQEVLAPKIIPAMLGSLARALGAAGAAVLELAEAAESPTVLHDVGDGLELFLSALQSVMREDDGRPHAYALGRTQVMTCQASTRFGHQAVLVAWRAADARRWDADDLHLIAAIAALMRLVLEHESIQRELARQARTDSLTGLLNRRAFLEEAQRRIERLERDGLPGTLMFVDLDRLKLLNDRLGHEAGDAALTLASTVLRRIVRAADLVARLGGDEFALWLDGFDELTAAERAEHLRLTFPSEAAYITEGEDFELTMSIGIACRQPGSGEELEDVIQRADQAMYAAKRNGRGHWRVSHPERV